MTTQHGQGGWAGFGLLGIVSIASIGVFAGAMATEAWVLVPYWHSLPAEQFLGWYAANAQRLFAFFAPVNVSAAAVALVAALSALRRRRPGRTAAVAACVLVLAATALYPLYFESVNANFAAGNIEPEDVPAELARWASWHWLRTWLAALALVAALASSWLERSEPVASREAEYVDD
jgi:hypothetical protein